MTDLGLGSLRSSGCLRVGGSVISVTGLVVVVVGTFSPWLSSGGVDRDSYAIAGIIGRLGLVGHGFGATTLSCWPFVGPVAVAALIAALVRWWRTCAWIAIAFGVLTGVIGGGVMAVAGGHDAAGIMLARTGPVITVIGAALSIVGGSLILTASARAPRAQSLESPRSLRYQRNRPAFLPVRAIGDTTGRREEQMQPRAGAVNRTPQRKG
jgi:hypothetical protein